MTRRSPDRARGATVYRRVEERPPITSYFAYGSNMDAGEMARRCPGATLIGLGALAGFRFLINSRGVATITPHPGSRVHGVLWSLNSGHLRALDRYEGVHHGLYSRTRVPVRAPTGAVDAWVYIAADSTRGSPRPGYLEGVVTAARRAGLPADYIAELEGAA